MLVGGFEKYTISRSLVNPTDRTGQRREVGALVGFLQKHKCLGHFQKKCSSHNCHEISVPFLTIGVFSDANISLDLYLRFLSKNEYLGLNCMLWKSTWWPWVTRWRKYMLWCHVYVTAHKPSDLWQQHVGCDKLCHKRGKKGLFFFVWDFCHNF